METVIEQALKESEAEELLEFAANPNPVIPHLLIRERVKEMSIAMAILCQAFSPFLRKIGATSRNLRPW